MLELVLLLLVIPQESAKAARSPQEDAPKPRIEALKKLTVDLETTSNFVIEKPEYLIKDQKVTATPALMLPKTQSKDPEIRFYTTLLQQLAIYDLEVKNPPNITNQTEWTKKLTPQRDKIQYLCSLDPKRHDADEVSRLTKEISKEYENAKGKLYADAGWEYSAGPVSYAIVIKATFVTNPDAASLYMMPETEYNIIKYVQNQDPDAELLRRVVAKKVDNSDFAGKCVYRTEHNGSTSQSKVINISKDGTYNLP